MAGAIAIDHEAVTELLTQEGEQDLLRFLTCGSVDDGKSTLIGRLLHDSKRLFEDQLVTLERDSRKHGTTGGEIDFALLVDGLEAEREQGITIDVAYRYFATDRRRFIVADTPGHEQYTRNMATGASTADLAVLLVDAQQGILRQTRRHAFIAWLLGIRHVVVAVNKIDLIGYDQAGFAAIAADFEELTADLGFDTQIVIPLSARFGDNVTAPSPNLSWYDGPRLLSYLEEIDVRGGEIDTPMRFPVQWVSRPSADFRGYAGTIASGEVKPGQTIVSATTGQSAGISRIVTADGDVDKASAGTAVTLTLDREIDLSRGDVIVDAAARPEVSDQLAAHVIWMSQEEMLPGRSYLLKSGTRTVGAAISELKHQVDVDSFKPLAAKTLGLNDIGFCNLSLVEPIAFDPYEQNQTTGSFILIDRFSNATVAAGMIRFGLRRATNIHLQALTIDKQARADAKSQRPAVLWFTGLSGAGKSTVANLLEEKLHLAGGHTYLLDGDNVRHGLNRDLGFTDADRVENIRRVGEASKLFVDAGLIVLVSFISPFRSERQMARDLVGDGEFVEIFVDVPLEVAEERDPKGLYRKARQGEIKNFTGIDSPYEPPKAPDIHLNAAVETPAAMADRVFSYLVAHGYVRNRLS